MSINLNKTFVTKEGLMKYINEVDVFSKYIDEEFSLTKNIISPLRHPPEKNPSFGFFVGDNQEVCFNDFVLQVKGDCVKFLMLKYNLSYFEALSKIATDFDLTEHFIVKKFEKINSFSKNSDFCKEKLLINYTKYVLKGYKERKWENHDIMFWYKYGISIETLNKYNVRPVSYYFLNDNPFKADKFAYCFAEYKDNKISFKIYQPYNQNYKWINNHDESVWQGWSQLPDFGEKLIITKSLKDVMAINQNLKIPTVSLQAEGIFPKQQVISELKRRFKQIFLFYDNDYDKKENWGQIFAEKLCNEFFFDNIVINDHYQSKDFTDFIKNHGLKTAISFLNNCIVNQELLF